MARLNAKMIRKSPSFVNTLKERVLDLRGKKIAFIENLDATEDQFDTIDLSHNDVSKLENFPVMNRLGSLLINNNNIAFIAPNLGRFLPIMHTLELAQNRLTRLADIDPLASLPNLQFLSLIDSALTEHPYYRLYVINKLKHLKSLDFDKVKQQEKIESAKKFDCKDAQYHLNQAAIMNFQTLDGAARLEKPDAKTAEAPDVTFKMKTDGQGQENGVHVVKQNEESSLIQLQEEVLNADSNSISITQEGQVELYIYRIFQQASYNVMVSWRKKSFLGVHIIPTAWWQKRGDCTYNSTVAIMVIKFKVLCARRPEGDPERPRHFNVRLSANHLKEMVLAFYDTEEGKSFNPGDRLAVCLLMAQRHGVVSEQDFEAGCLPESVRYRVADFKKLSDRDKHIIPTLLDKADMVLSSFPVTKEYMTMLPHDIYRYVAVERSVDPSGKKLPKEVHCVVLMSHGRAYIPLDLVKDESDLTRSEVYYEYLNSYSPGYGVDGCGYVYADSLARSYILSVVDV